MWSRCAEKKQLDMEEICSLIRQAKQKYQFAEFVIAPSTEALNRFILLHTEEFRRLGCIMTMVDRSLYEAISDKASFSRICNENKILTPKAMPLPEKWGGVPVRCQAQGLF